MAEFFTNPFYMLLLGLGLGLLLTLSIWFRAMMRQRALHREIESLKDHLHRQMSITAKGSEKLEKEIEHSKTENENLRSTIQVLKNKPGRAELHTLHVYDKAIHLMNEKSPGFAPAWESALREAEQQVEESETGVRALFRKVFQPSLSGPASESGNPDLMQGEDRESDRKS